MFFVFILMFVCCDGFLIDTTNPPGPGQYMTDKHYKILMDLFIEERQARVHLEDFVTQLQKELAQTQTAVGNKLHGLNKENNTLEQYVKELKNKTEVLDIRLLDVESENIQLKMELNFLRKSHSALEVQYNQIKQNYATFENRTHYFDTEIQSLKQLKSVADLQAVFKIANQTDHLEHELQNTNSQIVVLQSSENARKQDFLALYNKTLAVEQTMKTKFLAQTGEQSSLKTEIHNVSDAIKTNSLKVKKMMSDFNTYTQRVAVSLYPIEKIYQSGSTIMFTGIRTSNGISSAGLTDIRNKGYFTCDKPGIHLVAISLVTYTVSQSVRLYKNDQFIKHIYLKHENSDETTTLTLLLQLNHGDTVSLKSYGGVIIHDKEKSELIILQITT